MILISYNVKIIRTGSYIEIYEYGSPISSGYEKIEKTENTKAEKRNYDDSTEIESREKFNDMFDKFITRFNYHFLNTKKRKLKYIATLEKQTRGHIMLISYCLI